MRLLVRFLGWATLLVIPCWLASPPYQRFTAQAATAAMAEVGFPWILRSVNIFAPCDIGIFAALVLATTSAPRRARVTALLKGIPVLLVVEVITAVFGCVQITLRQPPQSEAKDQIRTFLIYVIDSALLWSPLLVWLTLLGPGEMAAAQRRGLDSALHARTRRQCPAPPRPPGRRNPRVSGAAQRADDPPAPGLPDGQERRQEGRRE
jgi:hypothetical protein